MEKKLQQKHKLYFYSNYFKSTVGEIAMKLCYFNNFQHFQILLLVTDRCSKVEKSLRRGGKKTDNNNNQKEKKNQKENKVVQTCLFTWIFLSKVFFWQPNSHQLEANSLGQNQLSCYLAHSFDSLCFPGCFWRKAVQIKRLLLVAMHFTFRVSGDTQKPHTTNVLHHILTSHSGVTG